MNEPSADVPVFYKQFLGANRYLIAYPSNDYDLPDWDEDGNLIEHEETEWATGTIEAVYLGGNRYRLAQKLDAPFSDWKLEWGEEFLAESGPESNNSLILRQVVMPGKYVHEVTSCVVDPGIWRTSKESALIHELNGGWEYALAVLKVSIPVENYQAYRERLALIGDGHRMTIL